MYPHMDCELASLHRAQNLLRDKSTDTVVGELQLRFDVDFVEAVAAVAVATALTKRGVAIAHGQFVRPYTLRLGRNTASPAA